MLILSEGDILRNWQTQTMNYLSIKKRLEITVYKFEIYIILGTHLNGSKGSSK